VNNKSLLSVFFTAILIGGLVLAEAMRFGTVQASTGASGNLKPSVPEFTMKFEDHSYDVPSTYKIDTHTGKNVTTRAGYHVQKPSLVFTIKNQPFTPYNDTDGNLIELHYEILAKEHFKEGWTQLGSIASWDSEYATVSYDLGEYCNYWLLREIKAGDQVDCKIKALIGYFTIVFNSSMNMFESVFTGTTSDWSNIQTIIIGESQTPTPSQEPILSPEPEPEPFPTALGIAASGAAVAIAGVGVLVYFRKRGRGHNK
jgi:hypothetical protein